MISVETMSALAEQFFSSDTQFPKERYPIITVKNGKPLGGFLYYVDPTTGIMGVYLKKKANVWFDHKSLAELIEFPFYYLGKNIVITTIQGISEIQSLCEKTGGVVDKENPKKILFTRENSLKAAQYLKSKYE